MRIIEEKEFVNVEFDKANFGEEHYEECAFKQCDFTTYSFNNARFTDCTFIDCNLSNISLNNCGFWGCEFLKCKLLGLHFNACNPIGLSFRFQDCQLNYSSFFQLKLKKTLFIDCKCEQVDFSASDFTQSAFKNCDLTLAVFDDTNLEKCDFSSAYNYEINPISNKVKNAIFAINGLPGLLTQFSIKIV